MARRPPPAGGARSSGSRRRATRRPQPSSARTGRSVERRRLPGRAARAVRRGRARGRVSPAPRARHSGRPTRRSPPPRSKLADVDAVAVTRGPGLIGALLVGVSAAKALAWSQRLPLIPVDHLHGHVASLYLRPPARAAVHLPARERRAHDAARRHRHAAHRVLGTTLDDAAGEAFDKGARLLGLGYPGGRRSTGSRGEGDPERLRLSGRARARARFLVLGPEDGAPLPRTRPRRGTSWRNGAPIWPPRYQRAIVRALVERTSRRRGQPAPTGSPSSAAWPRTPSSGRRSRTRRFAPLALCTDNAAMIASAARTRPRPVSGVPFARCYAASTA